MMQYPAARSGSGLRTLEDRQVVFEPMELSPGSHKRLLDARFGADTRRDARDGEQQAGVEFTADDKLRIATALAEAGIHRIEAGLPAVSPADKQAIDQMVAEKLPTEIYAFSRCMVSDVDLALDCGVAGVVMEVPASHHLIEKAYKWPVQKAIDASIEATRYAHENGLKVTFFPIDATRASMSELLDDLESVAAQGHVDNIALVDTFGVTSPHAIRYYTQAK